MNSQEIKEYLLESVEEKLLLREQKIVECNDIKIEVLSEKKKPDIVIDTSGRTNVNQQDIAQAVGQLNHFIMVAEIQKAILQEMKEEIESLAIESS